MKVAIMIPMDDASASEHRAPTLRPRLWGSDVPVWPLWPERYTSKSTLCWREVSLFPRWPADVANDVQRAIEKALADGREEMVIVTRCEMVVLCAQRMMIEGVPIEMTIHFPGSDHPAATFGPDGEVNAWPAGLFSEDFEEVKAIRRAQKRSEA